MGALEVFNRQSQAGITLSDHLPQFHPLFARVVDEIAVS